MVVIYFKIIHIFQGDNTYFSLGFTIHNQPDVKRYENLLPRSLLKFARNLQVGKNTINL